MVRAAEQKEENLTAANKKVWLKQEAFRLRHKDIDEDKEFVDNERRA